MLDLLYYLRSFLTLEILQVDGRRRGKASTLRAWALNGMVNVSSLRELVCPEKAKMLVHPVPLVHEMQ